MKKIKKKTKAQIKREEKRRIKKEWQILSKEIRKNGCEICGKKEFTDTHHILSFKHYPQFRLEPNNLICLCKSHHKFGKYSAHQNGFWFSNWVKNFKKERYEWLISNME